MAQYLRPNSTVTATGMTGNHTAVDEATPSDSDYAYGTNGGGNVFEVGLSTPSGTPASGTATFRVRVVEIESGSPATYVAGTADPVTVQVLEGTTSRFSTTLNLTGSWTTHTFSPDLSAVSDWSNLRVRLSDTSHSTIFFDRAQGISWIELEVDDPAAGGGGVSGDAAFSVDAPSVAASGSIENSGDAALGIGPLPVAASGEIVVGGSSAIEVSALSFASSGNVILSGSGAVTLLAPSVVANGVIENVGAVGVSLGAVSAVFLGASGVSGSFLVTVREPVVSFSEVVTAGLAPLWNRLRIGIGLGL